MGGTVPTKKQIIIIAVLAQLSMGLGYWYGLPDRASPEKKASAGNTEGTIVIEAENFTRGKSVVTQNPGQYGEGIGVILTRVPATAEFDITLKESGSYLLLVRYAALEARPCNLSLNGTLVKDDFAGKTTGTWYPDSQRYFFEGLYPFKAGLNTLKIECLGTFPSIDKLKLVLVE